MLFPMVKRAKNSNFTHLTVNKYSMVMSPLNI